MYHILLDELSQLEHDILPSHDTPLLPGRESPFSSSYGSVHLLLRGTGYARDDLLGGRVVVVDPSISFRLDHLTIDEQLHRRLREGGGVTVYVSV